MTGGDADAAVARSRAGEAALWERVGREWGWVDDATIARLGDRLLGVDANGVTRYPGFQVGADGEPLPVIGRLPEVAERAGWTEQGVVEWLMSPTTYLDGSRPVDLLAADADRVLDVAESDLGIEW
jgi:hypothetical protein